MESSSPTEPGLGSGIKAGICWIKQDPASSMLANTRLVTEGLPRAVRASLCLCSSARALPLSPLSQCPPPALLSSVSKEMEAMRSGEPHRRHRPCPHPVIFALMALMGMNSNAAQAAAVLAVLNCGSVPAQGPITRLSFTPIHCPPLIH